MNEEAIRKAFEAWATKSGSVSLRPWLGGGTESAPYHYDSTNTAWLAWRAATRAAAPAWLPIESAPTSEDDSFLVVLWDDGRSDLWPVDDQAACYEFSAKRPKPINHT